MAGRQPSGLSQYLGGQEQLDPFLTQPGGAVQASQEGDFLVLGEVDQMVGRQDGVEGLLVKGDPQEPEKDEGQEPGRPPGEPEGREGDANEAEAGDEPPFRRVQAPGRTGEPRHQGQDHRQQGPGERTGLRLAVCGSRYSSLMEEQVDYWFG